MRSFNEIYDIVEESSHETAFNKGEAFALYSLLLTLPEYSSVVEVGVQYGRSTSVIAEIQKERKFFFLAVDNYCEEDGETAYAHVQKQIKKYGWNFHLLVEDSVNAAEAIMEIDLVHIDGDHTYEGVLRDIKAWLPKVKKGGYALFDDYGHPGLDGVVKAINEYMKTEGPKWRKVGVFGNKLGVFKRK